MTSHLDSHSRSFISCALAILLTGLCLLNWQPAQADTQYSPNGWGVGTTYQASWASSCRWEDPYIANRSPCYKQVSSSTLLYVSSDQAVVYLYPQHHWYDCLNPGNGCSYGSSQHAYPPPYQGSGSPHAFASYYYAGWPSPGNYNWDIRGYAMHCDNSTDPYQYSCWWTSDGF